MRRYAFRDLFPNFVVAISRELVEIYKLSEIYIRTASADTPDDLRNHVSTVISQWCDFLDGIQFATYPACAHSGLHRQTLAVITRMHQLNEFMLMAAGFYLTVHYKNLQKAAEFILDTLNE